MGMFDKPIALDPGVGGRCITLAALEPADITKILAVAREAEGKLRTVVTKVLERM